MRVHQLVSDVARLFHRVRLVVVLLLQKKSFGLPKQNCLGSDFGFFFLINGAIAILLKQEARRTKSNVKCD